MQTHAVILIGGRQYIVKEGDEVVVQNINKEPKDTLDLPILMTFNESDEVEVGAPELKKVAKAEVIENMKGDKIRVAKFKSKVRYRRVVGFRPRLSKIKIVTL
jgi:large subunit ribosomal protein L21